jgi:hypothetical protein
MIGNITGSQEVQFPQYSNPGRPAGSLLNFDVEDEAIISAQAKILNELEKFNAGAGNELDLALATVMGEIQVEAAATVIKTKDEMVAAVMDIID